MPDGAHQWIFGSSRDINRRGHVPLLQRSVDLVQFSRISLSSLNNPPNQTFENDGNRDNQNRDERIHNDAAFEKVLENLVASGPFGDHAAAHGDDVRGQDESSIGWQSDHGLCLIELNTLQLILYLLLQIFGKLRLGQSRDHFIQKT